MHSVTNLQELTTLRQSFGLPWLTRAGATDQSHFLDFANVGNVPHVTASRCSEIVDQPLHLSSSRSRRRTAAEGGASRRHRRLRRRRENGGGGGARWARRANFHRSDTSRRTAACPWQQSSGSDRAAFFVLNKPLVDRVKRLWMRCAPRRFFLSIGFAKTRFVRWQ